MPSDAVPTDAAPADGAPVAIDARPAVPDAAPPPVVSLKLPDPGAPCFPDRPTVSAIELARHVWATGTPRSFGSCTVERDGDDEASVYGYRVRAADDRVVAHVGCGLSVVAPRIVDDRGLGVGVRGRTVLARHGDDAAARLFCHSVYQPSDGRVICRMPLSDGTDAMHDDQWTYTVSGKLDDVLHGEAAIAFFAPRRVVAMTYRGSCH